MRENVEPLPGTADLLRACAACGLAVVLVTSGAEADLEWMLPAIGAAGRGGGHDDRGRRRGRQARAGPPRLGAR